MGEAIAHNVNEQRVLRSSLSKCRAAFSKNDAKMICMRRNGPLCGILPALVDAPPM